MADESTSATPAVETETKPAEEQTAKTNHVLETPVDGPDPDEAELKAAEAEVAAEAKAAAEAPPPEATPAATPAAAPAETPVATPGAEPAMVPVTAVQAERQKRQDVEEAYRKQVATTLYYKGVADGRLPIPQGGEQQQPPARTDRVKDIRAEQRELSKQVDAGTLSTEEYEAQRQTLDDELLEIREQRLLDEAKRSMPQSGHDLYLETQTAKLETENPWVKNIPGDEMESLIPFARKALATKGIDMKSINGTPAGDYRLREALIDIGKEFGFDKRYAAAPAAGTPAAPAPPVVARPTEAQRKEKEALAASAPPTPVGTTAPVTTWSEERVASMDALDLENMPMSELRRIGDTIDREAAAARTHTTYRR